MKRDAARALTWLEENNPFNHDRDNQLLVSFSTGFTSTANDGVNAERAAEVGREMQKKMDAQPVTSTMEVISRYRPYHYSERFLSSMRGRFTLTRLGCSTD